MTLLRGRFLAAIFLAVAVAGPSACGGDDDTGDPLEPLEPRLSSIQSEVFEGSCIFSACHDSSQPGGNLDLSGADVHAALVGRASTMSPGAMLVVPGDPDQSFLIKKLRGPLGEGEGARMPLTSGALDEETIQVIEEWISLGAPND